VAQAVKEIFDATGPAAKVARKILERHVQSSSVKWWMALAKPGSRYKVWARKFSSPSQRSVPDFLFSVEYTNNMGLVKRFKFAVEFKAPGKTSTEAQLDEQQKMRDAGWDVYECDDVEKFKEIARRYL
jgi:hypothetical protein